MPRLPVPGGDDGVWGDILNDFLLSEHNADGSLKHAADTADAHAASAISFTPAGSIAATTVQAAIEEVAAEAGGAGASDHGSLTGLSDDDHPQYHNDARGDARYWQLSTDLATQAELDTHSADTTSVHGIADTSILLTTTAHDVRDHSAALSTAALADLGDVAATVPNDGQVLTFDTTNGWQPESIPAGDHGALTGLSDDDHTQYLLTSGTRTTTGVTLTSSAAGTIPLIVKADASQSANLQEWKLSNGTVLASFDNLGRLSIGNPGTGAAAIAGGDGSPATGARRRQHSASGVFGAPP